uniref:Uncharacterized protein n=1 Tax=Physcomitrium patens TaxID=3218 RepID=A0A2K1JXQ0_PHYPA|nr:hypothetical protein PHYPA_013408 [Physcomitrium patens]
MASSIHPRHAIFDFNPSTSFSDSKNNPENNISPGRFAVASLERRLSLLEDLHDWSPPYLACSVRRDACRTPQLCTFETLFHDAPDLCDFLAPSFQLRSRRRPPPPSTLQSGTPAQSLKYPQIASPFW